MADNVITFQFGGSGGGNSPGSGVGVQSSQTGSDPVAAARDQIERERQAILQKAAYLNMTQGPADVANPGAVSGGQIADLMKKFTGGGGLGASAANLGMAAGGLGDPISAVIQVSEAMRKKLLGAIDDVGNGLNRLAHLDTGMFADGLQSAMSHLGPFGEIASHAVGAFRAFIAGLDNLAERLAPFSPALAMAEGQASGAQTVGDMRRAQRIGDELASFVQVRSQLEQAGEDLMVEVLKPLIPIATDLLENVLNLVQLVKQIPGVSSDAENQDGFDWVDDLMQGGSGAPPPAKKGFTPFSNIVSNIGALATGDFSPGRYLDNLFGS